MSDLDVENWMHASDEERLSIHADWDVDNDQGMSIAEEISALLIKECVYDVLRTEVIKTDGKWQILAYADSDYDSLKDRDIVFLGFQLVFKKIDK